MGEIFQYYKRLYSKTNNEVESSDIDDYLDKRLVYDRLYTFLIANKLLNNDQYGFRKFHSTEYAIVKLYDRVSSALTNHEHVIGVFMDLSKAFDTLDHSILLKKLYHYGIRGIPLDWFRSYLSCFYNIQPSIMSTFNLCHQSHVVCRRALF